MMGPVVFKWAVNNTKQWKRIEDFEKYSAQPLGQLISNLTKSYPFSERGGGGGTIYESKSR